MGFFENWVAVLTKPKDTFASRKKDASIMAGAKPYAIMGLLLGLVVGVAIAGIGAAFAAAPGLGFIAALGVTAIPLMAIVGALFQIIGSLLASLVSFLFAKLLGGTGDFKTHYFLPSLYVIPVTILALIFNIIPFVGAILGFVLGVYNLYLLTLAFKEAHGLSTLKAILVWLLPVLLVIVLLIVLLGSVIALVMGAVTAAKPA